jgi:HlyD family secretion protein
MKTWLIRLAVLAVIVLAIVLLRLTLFAPDPVAVRVASVEVGVVESTITNSKAGTVRARRRAGLSTGAAGIVVSLDVERGDRITAGQVLLKLDDRSQRSELDRAERQHAWAQEKNGRACLAAERARREWERNKELGETEGIVSVDRLDALESAYDLATADCQVAAAEVALAAATIEVARAEHEKTILIAPFDAIVAEVSVELGEWVTPSVPLMAAPDLIDAIDPSSLYVSAPMDEVDARLLEKDQRVRVTIDPFPGQSFRGRIVRIAPYVLDLEQQNRTLEIEVELEDEAFAATLLPGTSADTEVILEVREGVLRIPSFALMPGNRVLVLEDELLLERSVVTGIRNWDWTEITSGLQAGEQVVTSLDRPDVGTGTAAVVEEAGAGP